MSVQRHLLLVALLLLGFLLSLVHGQEPAPPSISPTAPGNDMDPTDLTQNILLIIMGSLAGLILITAAVCLWVREARANRRQMPKSLPPGYPGYDHHPKTALEKGMDDPTYHQSNSSTGSFLPPYPGNAAAAGAAAGAVSAASVGTGAGAMPALPLQATQGAPITVVVDAPSPTYSPPKTVDNKTLNSARTRAASISRPSLFSSSSSSSSSSSPTTPPKQQQRDRAMSRSNSKLANLVGMGHNFSGDHDGSLSSVATIEQGRNAGFGLGYDAELANQYEQQQNKRASAILMEQVLNTPPRSPSPSQMLFGPGGGGDGSTTFTRNSMTGHRNSQDYGQDRNVPSNLSVY